MNIRERTWTARIIARERDRIMDIWQGTVRERVPGLRALSKPLLHDHLPQSLIALAEWMDTDEANPRFALLSEEHGIQRLSHGILLREIASEYRVLREIILGVVAEHDEEAPASSRAARAKELARLNSGLDYAVTRAIETYADIREDAVKMLQERLQLAIDAAGVGTWDFDPITRVFAWDNRCRALFGLPSGGETVTYAEFLDAIHPDDRAHVDAEVSQVLLPGGPRSYRGEYRVLSRPAAPGADGRRADGERISSSSIEEHWVLSEGRILFDHQGHAIRFIGTAVDVSAAHRVLAVEQGAREQADAAHATLHALFMGAPVAIAVTRGPKHRFELANAYYMRMVGKRSVVGQDVADALPEVVAQGFPRLLDQVYETGVPYYGIETPVELRHEVDGGRLHTALLNFAYEPIRDPDGRVTGVFTLAFDVSENVRARKIIEDAKQLAEENAARESAARQEAEDAARRSAFLVSAVEHISHRLHVETILQEVTSLIVPEIADMATARIVGPKGELRLVSAAVPPTVESEMRDQFAVFEAPSGSSNPFHEALTTDVRIIDDFPDWITKQVASPEYVAFMRGLGVTQIILVPMKTHDTTVGLLTVGLVGKERTFDPAHTQILRTLGKHAALAIENARLYEEAQELRRRAEEASVAKDQFIATVSHELRTPLNAILGWAQIIKANPGAAPMLQKGMDTIERNARAQSQLIEDLLDISRIVVGKLRIEPSSVFIPRVIESALDSARPAAEAKKIELVTDVDPDVGHIIADPDRLQQVVWNLISNSVKFTPPGGKVSVSAHRKASQFEFSVCDNGKGIAPDFLPYVFEKFHQVEQGTRKTGGLGLGLAIVRNIVELHGGTVSAESEGLGKGACFTVRIPIRAALRPHTRTPHPPNAPEDAAGEGGGDADLQLPARILDGVRLLIVDDEPDARELLTAILGDAGAIVRIAASVDEAVTLLDAEVPDALVSDIGMPGKDGHSLARHLRALPREQGGRIPAVALTAHARSEDRTRALTAGFTTHIPKPVDPTELIVVLANALGRDVQDLPGSNA
ncbi:hybrid sensor histidine kinase/response regulator [Chondromyces apiculatus]|uniref:hybrid sensor histidine kinase/response regulator n=1 Tax=Chondromyces apiculatus TaxID=51 RepID=UPI0006933B67|nr:ATP-binding protein [Chondromyces apiculatus]